MKMKMMILLVAGLTAAMTLKAQNEARNEEALRKQAEAWQSSVASEGKKDYSMALVQLSDYGAAGGDPYLVHLRTGWLHYLKGDFKKAELAYRSAAGVRQQAVAPLLGLLNCARLQKDERDIQTAAENLLRLDPANYTAWITLGESQYRTQKYREASQTYRKAVAVYPEDQTLVSGLAWSLYQVGEKREAAELFRVLLGMNAAFPYAKQGLDLATGKTQPKQ